MLKQNRKDLENYMVELGVSALITDAAMIFAAAHIEHFMKYSQKNDKLMKGEIHQDIAEDLKMARANMLIVFAASRISLQRDLGEDAKTAKVQKEKTGKKASQKTTD